MDKELIESYLEDIQGRKNIPYSLGNEKLAAEIFPYVKSEFPYAIMIKTLDMQYIVVTKKAVDALTGLFMASKTRYQSYIAEIETAVNQLITRGVLS